MMVAQSPALPPGSHIVIVGAGIVGVCCAAELAGAGFRVTLIDPARPGRGGASFANAGHIATSAILPLAAPGILAKAPRLLLDPEKPLHIPLTYWPRIAPWLVRFARASTPSSFEARVKALSVLHHLAVAATGTLYAQAGLSDDLRQTGGLFVYGSEKSFAAAHAGWQRRKAEGFYYQELDQSEISMLEPALAPLFPKAVYDPSWCHVADPLRVVERVFALAIARGAAFARIPVAEIKATPDGVTVGLRDGRPIRADAAVLAAGAWSKPFVRQLGDNAPLDTERGYNLTIADPGVELGRSIAFSDFGVVATPLDGGFRFGGWDELGGLKAPPNPSLHSRIRALARRFFPGLRTDVRSDWMGHRPSLPDGLPVIGWASGSRRVLYAFGHGHYGLTQAPATALLIRDLATGMEPSIDPAPFAIDRFS